MLFALLAACRPERVENPHAKHVRTGDPVVERDTTMNVAPEAVVHARDGSQYDLAQLWATKRVVLVFYMGHWCPHCQKQLGDLNEHQKEFADLGATIVAISSDSATDAEALHDRMKLGFELYVDPDLSTIARWGVENYDTNIARPATFIIEPGGAISYRRVSQTATDRPSTDEVLAALRTQ